MSHDIDNFSSNNQGDLFIDDCGDMNHFRLIVEVKGLVTSLRSDSFRPPGLSLHTVNWLKSVYKKLN